LIYTIYLFGFWSTNTVMGGTTPVDASIYHNQIIVYLGFDP